MTKNHHHARGGIANRRLRILAVDDHAAVLSGLRDVLRETYDVDTAGTAIDATEQLMGARYDILLLDYYIGPVTCVRVAEISRTRFPETKICVLTHFVNQEVMGALAHVHPEAVLDKSIPVADLLSCLDRVMRGETAYSPAAVEMLMRLAARKAVAKGPAAIALSETEHRVMTELSRGRTSSEIASALGVSVTFVTFVRSDLKQRFGVRSIAQLVSAYEAMTGAS